MVSDPRAADVRLMFDPYYQWLGIPPSQQPADHYRLLGVPRFETNVTAIAAAADQRLALVACHQGGPRETEAQRLIAELVEARACLTDAQRKMAYDDQLHVHVGGRPRYVPMQPPVDALLPPGAAPAGVPTAAAAFAAPRPPMATPSEPPTPFGDPLFGTPQKAPPPPAQKPASDEIPEEPPSSGRRIWLIAGVAIAAVVLLTGAIGVGLIVSARRGGEQKPPDDGVAQNPPPPPVEPVAPEIDETLVVRPTPGGELLFTPDLAQTYGIGLKVETRQSQAVLTGWTSTDNYVEWEFELEKPGWYDCEVTYSAVSGSGKYLISAQEMARPYSGTVRSGGTDGAPVTDGNKPIAFRRAGRKTLQMRATDIPGDELMSLFSIRLTYDAEKSRRP